MAEPFSPRLSWRAWREEELFATTRMPASSTTCPEAIESLAVTTSAADVGKVMATLELELTGLETSQVSSRDGGMRIHTSSPGDSESSRPMVI